MSKKIIIIGGGYSGLALANLLAKVGHKVTVLEKNAELGGRIAVFKQKGFTFDVGPSWYLMPEVFEQYYKLFNKNSYEELQITRLSPGYKVFYENHNPITVQGNLKDDCRTFDSVQPGAGKALTKYLKTSSKAYQILTNRLLYTNFQTLSQLLQPDIIKASPQLLPLVGQSLHKYASSNMPNEQLSKLLEYHMVFLGSSPFETTALYTLMSHLDFKSGVFYPKLGMYSLVNSLVEIGKSLGVTHQTNATVKEIIVKNKKAAGVKTETGETLLADIVVSAADMHFTETKLLSPENQTYPSIYWKKRQSGPSALLIALGVNVKLPQLEHHNLFLVNNWKENFEAMYGKKYIPKNASMYICNPNKTDPSLSPSGTENLFILLPLPSGLKYTNEAVEEIAKRTVNQLGKVIDEPELENKIITKHIISPNDFGEKYNAWELNAFAGESHLLRQSGPLRTGNVSKKVKNLYYVGAGSLPGIGLPMCLISAQLTFKRIQGIKKDGPLKSLETNR